MKGKPAKKDTLICGGDREKPSRCRPNSELYDQEHREHSFGNVEEGSIVDELFKMALRQKLLQKSSEGGVNQSEDFPEYMEEYEEEFEIKQPQQPSHRRKHIKSTSQKASRYSQPVRKVLKATNQRKLRQEPNSKRETARPRRAAKKISTKKPRKSENQKMNNEFEVIREKQEAFLHNSEESSASSVCTEEAHALAPVVEQMKQMGRLISNKTTNRKCSTIANEVEYDLWQLERRLRHKFLTTENVLNAEKGPNSQEVEVVAHENGKMQSNSVMNSLDISENSKTSEKENSESYEIDIDELQSDEENEEMLSSLQTTTLSLRKQDNIREIVVKVTKSVQSEVEMAENLLETNVDEASEEYFENETSDESVRSKAIDTCQKPVVNMKSVLDSPEKLHEIINDAFESAVAQCRDESRISQIIDDTSVVKCEQIVNSIKEATTESYDEEYPNMINSATIPDDSDVKVYTARAEPMEIERIDISGSLGDSRPLKAEDVIRYQEQLERMQELELKLTQEDQRENYELMVQKSDNKYSPRTEEEDKEMNNSITVEIPIEQHADAILDGLRSIQDIMESSSEAQHSQFDNNERIEELEVEKSVHIVSKLSEEEIFADDEENNSELFEGIAVNVEEASIEIASLPENIQSQGNSSKEHELPQNNVELMSQSIPEAFFVADPIVSEIAARKIVDCFIDFVLDEKSSSLNVEYFAKNQLVIDLMIEILDGANIGIFSEKERIEDVGTMELLSNQFELAGVHFEAMGSGIQREGAQAILNENVADYVYNEMSSILLESEEEESSVLSSLVVVERFLQQEMTTVCENNLESVAELIVTEIVDEIVTAILR